MLLLQWLREWALLLLVWGPALSTSGFDAVRVCKKERKRGEAATLPQGISKRRGLGWHGYSLCLKESLGQVWLGPSAAGEIEIPLTGAAAGAVRAGICSHLEIPVQSCWDCLWKGKRAEQISFTFSIAPLTSCSPQIPSQRFPVQNTKMYFLFLLSSILPLLQDLPSAWFSSWILALGCLCSVIDVTTWLWIDLCSCHLQCVYW